MDYKKLTIRVPHNEIELITAELMEMGIMSTEVEDRADVEEILSNKEEYEWDYADQDFVEAHMGEIPAIHIYFEYDSKVGTDDSTTEAVKQTAAQIAAVKERYKDKMVTEEVIHDTDWINSYKDHFTSLELTDTITVMPSWEMDKESNKELKEAFDHQKECFSQNDDLRKIIRLDPGMAFGTGDHATTHMCACLMEDTGVRGKKVLDVGTGSGILAIAAAIMGAKEVLGIDIDADAVRVAKENAAINHCDAIVKIQEGDLTRGIDFEADIVVANLMAELVCVLTEHVGKHLAPGGCYITSGILVEKEEMVKDALFKAGFSIEVIKEDGEWCAIAAKKTPGKTEN